MQVILLEKVANLGNLGDVVKVKDGYARNFLIPTRAARRATESAIKEFEAKRAEYQANHDVPGEDDVHDFGFTSMSTEWKYKVTDPAADAVGSLLYGELMFSSDKYEIEGKLVFSKVVGPFTFAYNFIWEAVLERSDDPAASPQWAWEHEVSNTLGASYEISPNFAAGVEAYDISRFERSLSGEHTHAYYAGPNVHYSGGTWWATLTLLQQIGFGHGLEFTDGDNTKYSIRLIVGFNF